MDNMYDQSKLENLEGNTCEWLMYEMTNKVKVKSLFSDMKLPYMQAEIVKVNGQKKEDVSHSCYQSCMIVWRVLAGDLCA